MHTDGDGPESFSPVDTLFEAVRKEDPDAYAVGQYDRFKLGAGKALKPVILAAALHLKMFDSEKVCRLTNTDSLHLENIPDEKTALFVIIPVLVLLANRSYAERCTERVTAIVAENRRVNRDKVTYRPVFEYSYQGRKYLTASNTSSSCSNRATASGTEAKINSVFIKKTSMSGKNRIFVFPHVSRVRI